MVTAALAYPREAADRFYIWMAAACALIAFGGFAPTFWLQLPAGTFVGPPLLHLHGVLFSLWPILLLSQAVLGARGRLDHHRAWGLAGIALAAAMIMMGLTVTVYQLHAELAQGEGDAARAFAIVPVTAIGLFAGFFAAAIANLARPQAHKRLILLATVALLQAAMGRVFFVLISGAGPGLRPGLAPPLPVVFTVAPALLLELLIVAGVVYDWRTRGRPHPAWLIGAAVITAVVLLRVPLSGTAAWLSFADALAHIAG